MWVQPKNIDLASNVFVLTQPNTHTEWDKSQTLILKMKNTENFNRKWSEILWEKEQIKLIFFWMKKKIKFLIDSTNKE